MNTTRGKIRHFVFSSYIDLFGAFLILSVCIYSHFHRTFYYNGNIVYDVPLSQYFSFIGRGAFPLGFFSTIGAVFSMLSTRFVGKQRNSGNVIGLATTVNSGAVDYFLGNHSAIITYPLTFVITSFILVRWNRGEKIRKIDLWYYLINIVGILIAYAMVYIGIKLFGGKDDPLFVHIVAISFGLSLGANFCTAFKYESTYVSWSVYNVVQLLKAIILLNIANIAKYIFYLLNSALTSLDWIWNRDAVLKKGKVKVGEEERV